MFVFLLYLAIFFCGGASLLFARAAFDYDEVQQHFFVSRYNFYWIMKVLSDVSQHALGRTAGALLKLNLMMLIFFVAALAYYTVHITGLRPLLEFVERGLTVQLSENERNYLLGNFPWYYMDYTRNSGREFYARDQYLGGIVLIAILFLVIAASSSLSLLNNLTLIRKLGAERLKASHAFLRVCLSLLVGATIDVFFFLAFLAAVVVGGRAVNISLEEAFKASVSQKWLEYGYVLIAGNHRTGESMVGLGIIVPIGDGFDQISVDSAPAPNWVHRLFPSPLFENDAGSLCHRYDLGGIECADRLRSFYFKHFQKPDSPSAFAGALAKQLYTLVDSLACGNNIWSPLVRGTGSQQAIGLALPWFAALAVVFISRFLILPCLALIVVFDGAIVRLGRYTARRSERGLSLIIRHGPALLAAPPIVAVGFLAVLARWLC